MGISEPWVALAETGTGHLVVPCGRDAARATAIVGYWAALTELGRPIDAQRMCVGAVVVNPDGHAVQGWGDQPTPGGRPRWEPILKLREVTTCRRCAQLRWPGCWMRLDLVGCALCLPATDEQRDPRPWPPDPPRPAGLALALATR
jgi:hypothetical protein